MKTSELRAKLETLEIKDSLETLISSPLGEMLIEAIEELETTKKLLQKAALQVQEIAQDVAKRAAEPLPTVGGLPQSWQEMLTLQGRITGQVTHVKHLAAAWKTQS